MTSPGLPRQLAESRQAIEAGDALVADELAALMANHAREAVSTPVDKS